MTGRGARTLARVRKVAGGRVRERDDQLATEEPLEIRVTAPVPRTGASGGDDGAGQLASDARGRSRTLAVTMRTPGNDFELAAGFLLGEGVIGSGGEIRRIRYCLDPSLDGRQRYNVVTVELGANPEASAGERTRQVTKPPLPDLRPLERHFFTSSACGVCGKAGLEALSLRGCRTAEPGPRVAASVIHTLPDRLREGQGVFEATGGLHAAALFDPAGDPIVLREDIGRHNAVDKLIGWAALEDRLPLRDHILMVSGRSSYEIMQKAAVAGVPIVCAVSAPSSLAVDLAKEFGMTLVGFVRGERFNVYAGAERIVVD